MGKYDDIINLPHHESDYHQRMPMSNRAAQFAPFAALNGHDAAILEKIRETEVFKELTDDEKIRLSKNISIALDNHYPVKVTYFIPDKTKSGGSYQNVKGIIKKWDEFEKILILKDGFIIPIEFIYEIEIKDLTV